MSKLGIYKVRVRMFNTWVSVEVQAWSEDAAKKQLLDMTMAEMLALVPVRSISDYVDVYTIEEPSK